MYVREPLPSTQRSTCRDGIIVSALSVPLLGQLSAPENKEIPLPTKRHSRLVRNTRHIFLTVYRRLFSLAFIGNLIGLGLILALNVDSSSPPLSGFATAASANMMVAILARQDYIVNILFKTCSLVPLSAPLRLRRLLAKVYEYGGVHSGAAFCSVMWFLVLTTFLTNDFVSGQLEDRAIMTFTYILLTLLLSIVITAYPGVRFASHNTFENQAWHLYLRYRYYRDSLIIGIGIGIGPIISIPLSIPCLYLSDAPIPTHHNFSISIFSLLFSLVRR